MAIPGKWELNIEWGCVGGYAQTFIAIYDDGTWRDAEEEFEKGTWWQIDDRIFLSAAPPYSLLYVGTIINDLVIGKMANLRGDSGCFYMGRLATLGAGKPASKLDLVGRPTA